MNTWFRFYNEVVDDPKVQRLQPALFRVWVNCLCLSSSNGGYLPSLEDCAYKLRMTKERAAVYIEQLISAGLFERDGATVTPHNWGRRQFNSDGSAERMRRHRAKQKERNSDVTSNVTCDVTPLRYTDTDTDTEQNRTDTPPIVPQKPERGHFGEFAAVCLFPEEYEKLERRLNGKLPPLIAELDRYSQSSPKKFKTYKSHYAVLLTWAHRRGWIQSDSEVETLRKLELAEADKVRQIFKSARGEV